MRPLAGEHGDDTQDPLREVTHLPRQPARAVRNGKGVADWLIENVPYIGSPSCPWSVCLAFTGLPGMSRTPSHALRFAMLPTGGVAAGPSSDGCSTPPSSRGCSV